MSTRASDVAARLGRSLAPHPTASRGGPPPGRRERFTVDLLIRRQRCPRSLGSWTQAGGWPASPKTEVARILIELTARIGLFRLDALTGFEVAGTGICPTVRNVPPIDRLCVDLGRKRRRLPYGAARGTQLEYSTREGRVPVL
jgi:hypothetical protein